MQSFICSLFHFQVVVSSFVYGNTKGKSKESDSKEDKSAEQALSNRTLKQQMNASSSQNIAGSWPVSKGVDLKNPNTDIDLANGWPENSIAHLCKYIVLCTLGLAWASEIPGWGGQAVPHISLESWRHLTQLFQAAFQPPESILIEFVVFWGPGKQSWDNPVLGSIFRGLFYW